jgi:hypothetical protein
VSNRPPDLDYYVDKEAYQLGFDHGWRHVDNWLTGWEGEPGYAAYQRGIVDGREGRADHDKNHTHD